LTIQDSGVPEAREFTVVGSETAKQYMTSQFTLQKRIDSNDHEPVSLSVQTNSNCPYEYEDTEDSFDRYKREADALYEMQL